MKPLFVLLAVFAISIAVTKTVFSVNDIALCARIGMSAMLLFTAIGHFAFTKGMSMMLPDFVPFKSSVVLITGLIEAAAAIGLLIPKLETLTGWLLILFFIVVLPANIHAARKRIDYQKGTTEGPGPGYLWFRIPLQVLFIVWVFFSSIYF